jgi:hypothetical protein
MTGFFEIVKQIFAAKKIKKAAEETHRKICAFFVS